MDNYIYSAALNKYNQLEVVISTSQGGSVKLVLEKRMKICTRIGERGAFDIGVVEDNESK